MPINLFPESESIEPCLWDNGRIVRARVTVDVAASGQYLDRYAAAVLEALPSKCSARKAARRGDLLVNGAIAVADYRVCAGDLVILLDRCQPQPVFNLSLPVIYEDDILAVIEKPPGFPVSGNCHRSIEHALPANLQPCQAGDALVQPRPVHRLDVPTGGVMLVAKSATALMQLSQQFQQRQVHKRYRAIVTGRLDQDLYIEFPVDGRGARSRVQVGEHGRSVHTDWITTVDLYPETGRTHQLRQHLAAIGHAIVGDDLYGVEGKTLHGKGLFLWALELGFRHPLCGREIMVSVSEPAKFSSYRQREQRRWQKYHGANSDSG